MNIDLTVLAAIALMHFVAVVSPGPDFAIVLKQSLQKGLRPALWTSFGIGAGILLHVVYSILGVSLVISTTPWLYQSLLYVAAAYFIWIGISALRSKPSTITLESSSDSAKSTWYKAFGLGFLTNGLNPKATLFFLALFTAAIPAETSLSTKAFYGIYLASATGVWFCFLSYVTNFKEIREAYQSHGHWFDRLMGIVLIVMAIILLWT
ncbi:MAG: threonine/homoserine/homoserine lactone efflux protein [Kangiellaceae bacterium]|jgi:threonine/homoserine/homoserine lactone efflux protein